MSTNDEEWKKLPEPELNWDKFQRVLYQDLSNVDANIRNAALQNNGQALLMFSGVRAHIITALGICELNKPKVFT